MELRVESELPVDEGNELLESMALLKNFERAIERLNTKAKGNPQTRKIEYGTFNPTKFGRTQGTPGLNMWRPFPGPTRLGGSEPSPRRH